MRDAIVTTNAIKPTLTNWYRIQTVRRRRIRRNHQPRIIRHNNRNRQGTVKTSTSLQDAVDRNHSCYKFKKWKTVWGNIPEAINECSTYGHYGGNINGLKPFGENTVKLLPLPQPSLRARTDARTNPSAQRATKLRSVLARVYAVSRQDQITTDVP
jgi:hypothetical protein